MWSRRTNRWSRGCSYLIAKAGENNAGKLRLNLMYRHGLRVSEAIDSALVGVGSGTVQRVKREMGDRPS
jgi:hypothetical protein